MLDSILDGGGSGGGGSGGGGFSLVVVCVTSLTFLSIFCSVQFIRCCLPFVYLLMCCFVPILSYTVLTTVC